MCRQFKSRDVDQYRRTRRRQLRGDACLIGLCLDELRNSDRSSRQEPHRKDQTGQQGRKTLMQ